MICWLNKEHSSDTNADIFGKFAFRKLAQEVTMEQVDYSALLESCWIYMENGMYNMQNLFQLDL